MGGQASRFSVGFARIRHWVGYLIWRAAPLLVLATLAGVGHLLLDGKLRPRPESTLRTERADSPSEQQEALKHQLQANYRQFSSGHLSR